MDLQDILNLDFSKAVDELKKQNPLPEKQGEWDDQYEVSKKRHKIFSDPSRQVYSVGEGTSKKPVFPAVLPVPMQKRIVNSAVRFLFGKPVTKSLNTEREPRIEAAFDWLLDTWNSNKLDFFNKKLARKVFSETRAAEVWFAIGGDGVEALSNGVTPKAPKIKSMLLAASNGDKLYPHYDQYGDMDAFTWEREITASDGNKKMRITVFTEEKTIEGTEATGNTYEVVETPQPIGKIPVVYYEQDEPDWADVQELIERLEMMISRHADTNDYFGRPAVKTKGKLTAMPSKQEDGRIFELEGIPKKDGSIEYGDVEYLTWDQSPESVKLEFEKLLYLIYFLTDTPDIGFDNMKTIGQLSGVAILLMFIGPTSKAADKQEVFGAGLDRRISLLKAFGKTYVVAVRDVIDQLDIDIKFNSILPENLQEILNGLVTARGGEPIMSEETAVSHNPLVDNTTDELDKLAKERESKKPSVENLAGSFGI